MPHHLRVDVEKSVISLYDVYRKLKPELLTIPDKLVGNNLRSARDGSGNSRFAAFLAADRRFSFSGSEKHSSPAIKSRADLSIFMDVLAAGLKGPGAIQQFSRDTQTFLSEHADLLDRLWPSTEQVSASQPSSCTLDKRDKIDFCHPSAASLDNVVACFASVGPFEPTRDTGVYTIKCPVSEVQSFVTVLGAHTHTFWVNKSATSTKQDAAETVDKTTAVRLRYKCFRHGTYERSDKVASADAETLQGADKNKKPRQLCTTYKCNCMAYISGSFNSGDNTVVLTCDLRHYRHEPGTPHDLRLLPLLQEVHDKLDSICRVIREKVFAGSRSR